MRWHPRRDVRKHMFDTFLVDIKMCLFQPKICGTRTIICTFGRCGGTRVATCENTPLICYPSTSRSTYSNPRSVASAASLRSCYYYSFNIIIMSGMGGDLGVEKGAIEFLAPKTPRAPPPGHWRVFARRHRNIFEYLGRRPQNARGTRVATCENTHVRTPASQNNSNF